jgi:acetyl-CoA C-acetyltransferase
MSADPWQVPVIISGAQWTERDEVVTPVDLAERAGAAALAGAPGVAANLDRVHVVGIIFGGGPAPASELARRLGLNCHERATTTVGGNTPQWLVGRAADDIAAGRVGSVLIVGAEAVHSLRLGAAQPDARGEPDRTEGDPRPGLSPEEIAAGLVVPAQVYPLFESVLADRAGRTFDEQRVALGRLMAPFTAVAATHPYAWFRGRATAEALARPSPDNRIAVEPYTKRMNACLYVDQGAALVVTSLGRAQALGMADQAVFIWSAADANDVWHPSQRPDLGASPGIAAAAASALGAGGIGVDEIGHFDLYSCFPSAIQIAAKALGLSVDDRRVLTVTGGLPYFGGPGNNYTTHAIATMADVLRQSSPGALGLVSGMGWYITKHSIGIYGTAPPPGGYRRGATSAAQARIDASAIPVAEGVDGEVATVVASTVSYDRGGDVTAAPVVARLRDGRRVVAKISGSDVASLAGRSLVGWTVRVKGRPPTYRIVEERAVEHAEELIP